MTWHWWYLAAYLGMGLLLSVPLIRYDWRNDYRNDKSSYEMADIVFVAIGVVLFWPLVLLVVGGAKTKPLLLAVYQPAVVRKDQQFKKGE